MKKIDFFKGKAKEIFVGTFLAGIVFTGNVFATTTELKLDNTIEFDNWNNLSNEEKKEVVMPRAYDVDIPDSILSKYEFSSKPRIINQLLGNAINPLHEVGKVTDSRFNLAEELNLRVEHQQNTTECWAFSLLKSVETNKALKSGNKDIEDFSERHMDYATARNFTDGINENGFYRDVGNGGLLVVGLAYLTNGQGAVLEEDMPFKNEEKRISLSEINKKVDTIVDDYSYFPSINKEYEWDSKGNTISVKYKKSDGSEYTETELNAVRNMIKEHLVKNGAIASMTGGGYLDFYNNSNPFKATAYNCNITTKIRDHAITIVGWDDNYSRENFGDGKKPSTDGAYIVLNTYGETAFDGGYMYISYEDYFIEEEIYGICSTSDVDYDKIYQYDYYGSIQKLGLDTQSTGSIGTVYERDKNIKETLTSVGVTLSNYSNIEIYINPNNSSLASRNLIKVGESSDVLSPGFHRIDITPVELTGNSFAIVVKQTSESGGFYFQIETNIANTAYALVDSENKSYISLTDNTWTNISNLNITGVDMSKADVCIKAYTITDQIETPEDEPTEEPKPDDTTPEDEPTEEPKPDDTMPEDEPTEEPKPDDTTEQEIELSTNYILKDKYIMNIEFNTTKETFLNDIKVNTGKNVINSDGTSVKDDEIIKTGMKLRLADGRLYTLIVKGDINMDGLVSLIDLSKLLLHYNGVKGFELEGDALKGADMNIDGDINLVDLSQMLVLYNSI
ncbi:MAG: hypothetical protein IKL55_02290 [Clostridia bacterium]|nr:hypothetical protein [Clostridia bacterium]